MNTLPTRLRALYAHKVHHYTPVNRDGTPSAPAFAVVATDERLQVLLQAADALEQAPTLTVDMVRAAALAQRGTDGDISARAAISGLCERLGVVL